MKKFLFLFVPWSLWAQAAVVSPGPPPASVRPGGLLPITINLSAGGLVAGAEYFVQITGVPGVTLSTFTGALASNNASKSTTCNAAFTCIVAGVNANTMQDGAISVLTFQIPANAQNNSTVTIAVSSPTLANNAANAIAVNAGPSVSVAVSARINNCDIDGDGQVNATDVALEQAKLLAVPASGDLNADGKSDVLDLQIVVNAALGGACTAR